MTSPAPSQYMARIAAAIGLLAAAPLATLPAPMCNTYRAAVGDLLHPGLKIVQQLLVEKSHPALALRTAPLSDDPDQQIEDDTAAADNTAIESTNVAAVALRDQSTQIRALTQLLLLSRNEHTGDPLPGSQPLFARRLIEARLLGQTAAKDWRSSGLLQQGQHDGVYESALVLNSTGPLLDLGEDHHLHSEDVVMLGRYVVGKVATAGRWSSTFCPVHNRGFSAPAQLARQASTGWVWGAYGELHGNGDGTCRLTGLASDQIAEPGDLVFLALQEGEQPVPLQLGTIEQANLQVGDREWTITVQPITPETPLTRVAVLRNELNTARFESPRALGGPRGASELQSRRWLHSEPDEEFDAFASRTPRGVKDQP